MYRLDPIDFGKRMAVERELDKDANSVPANAIFDESGDFLIYPTALGIKIVSIVRNKVARLLGKVESSTRFLALALYQGAFSSDSQPDPTLFCAAHNKQRFYMFTRREPTEPDEANIAETGRDVFNEKPSIEAKVTLAVVPSARLAKAAVIHTTMGDIHIKLFG
jgi:peptidylprolyl isomerase domain and WD repeat-containing protein 1